MTTPGPTPPILDAIEELSRTFANSTVEVQSDGTGGAWVTIDEVAIGNAFEQPTSWVGFQITFPYPDADVYPIFVRGDLRRRDGQALGEGFQQPVAWGPSGIIGTQISRRSNRLDTTVDTAATKILKVLHWLGER